MNTNLSQSILKKIERDGVEPRSRWQFIAKRTLLWVPGVLSIIVGALSISGIIFGLTHAGWRYAPFVGSSLLKTGLTTLPYLWIILAGIFAFGSIKLLRTTRHGYRYRAATLVLASILLSVVLGVGAYATGIGKYLDTQLAPRLGARSTITQQQTLWSSPIEGRLAGHVRKIGDDNIRIRDFDGYFWNVDISDTAGRETTIFNTIVDRNNQIRIIGYIDQEFPNTFHACLITPMLPPHRGDKIQRPPLQNTLGTTSAECGEVLERK